MGGHPFCRRKSRMSEGKGAKSQKFASIAGKIGRFSLVLMSFWRISDFDTTFSAKTSKKTPTVLQTAIKQRFPAVYRKKFSRTSPPISPGFWNGSGAPPSLCRNRYKTLLYLHPFKHSHTNLDYSTPAILRQYFRIRYRKGVDLDRDIGYTKMG